jgi:hypothetical protein
VYIYDSSPVSYLLKERIDLRVTFVVYVVVTSSLKRQCYLKKSVKESNFSLKHWSVDTSPIYTQIQGHEIHLMREKPALRTSQGKSMSVGRGVSGKTRWGKIRRAGVGGVEGRMKQCNSAG